MTNTIKQGSGYATRASAIIRGIEKGIADPKAVLTPNGWVLVPRN